MNALVATSHHRSPEHRDSEVVSPELVLVDPVMAAAARQQLPEAADSLTRAIRVAAQPSNRSSEALVALATAALEVADELASPSTGPRSRSWSIVAGVAAAMVVGLLLLDVHVQVGRTPASADTAVIGKPPVGQSTKGQHAQRKGTQQPSSSSGRLGHRAAPQPRRFAWAPTPSASGYRIELFRGTERVFSSGTIRPQITIPAHWKLGGQRRSLTPGEYRWYVWPVVSGQRASQAIVQAKLVVQ